MSHFGPPGLPGAPSGLLHDVLSIVRGVRQGLVYGAKIRAPHASVMVFLFRDGTFVEKLRVILKLTVQHAKNLAKFTGMYKSMLLLLRLALGDAGRQAHPALAGGVAGAVVFGAGDAVTKQITMYTFARVALGVVNWMVERDMLPNAPKEGNALYAALTWAAVMYLFEHDRHTMNRSMVNSMQFLYHDANQYPLTANPLEWLATPSGPRA